MDVVKSFFSEYGVGFLLLIGGGFLAAGLIEVIIKNSAKWLEQKWAGHEKLIALLCGAKIVVTQVVAWVLSVWFAQLVCKVSALPGGDVLLPLWVSLIYLSQYIFSCFGIKGFLEWLKKRSEREPKQKKEKLVLTKTDYPGIYKDADGNLVDKKGNPVNFN